MRILVIEDETKVARALQEGLAGEGYRPAPDEVRFDVAMAHPW